MTSLIFFILVVFVGGVGANPDGPPLSACADLTPGHPTSTGNKDPVPWNIEVTPAMYAPGDTITGKVHIQIPPTGYVGFILRSTAVATASQGTLEGTMGLLWCYCEKS